MGSRYSESVIEHFMSPHNRGKLQAPDATAWSGAPGEGPFFVLQCHVRNGIVTAAAFESHNCGVTVACGSALTQLILNRSVSDCLQLTVAELIEALEHIPMDKQHVPVLVLDTLRRALQEVPPT